MEGDDLRSINEVIQKNKNLLLTFVKCSQNYRHDSVILLSDKSLLISSLIPSIYSDCGVF